MIEQNNEPILETPLEAAARAELVQQHGPSQTEREEQEADRVIADIDAHVARTDPASLPEAEQALNDWQIPTSPLDGVPDSIALNPGEEGDPLMPVFAAQTEMEANIVRGLLEAAGIPATFDGLPAPAMGNIFQAGEARWADILVPARLADAARAAIAEATASAEPMSVSEPSSESESLSTEVHHA